MSKVNNNYEYLITKLDEFIRKFYKNKLIRGSIYVVAALAAGYIILTVGEYYSYFSSGFRTIIFYSFIVLALLILCFYVFRPLLAYFRLGQVINHNTASEIIGNHFPEIKDKLLNTLQLHSMGSSSADRSSLIEASINQKIEQLRPIPFTTAINLKENKKYIKYALIPVAAILLIGAAAPSVLKEGTTRLVNYNKTFERKAPFQFNVSNKKLKAFQNDDFTLELKMSGEEIPQDIYLIEGENRYKLDKVNIVTFKYLFKNLQKSQTFQLFADGFYSKEFTLEVLPNPTLVNFQVMLIYPGYIKKKNEVVNNTGDLSIPAGTVVSWNFKAANTEKLEMVFDNAPVAANRDDDNTFSFSCRFLKSSKYAIHTQNSFVDKKDSLNYTINVTPDLSPSISVQERRDSISN